MLRVLHVLGGLNLGGAETMVMNLYRTIDRSSIQFDFVTHIEAKQAYEEEILSLGGKIYRFPAFNRKNSLKLYKIWNDFFENHPEYSIMHSHVRSYASIFIPIAKKHGVVTIIHSHSTSEGKGLQAFVKRCMQVPLKYQADYLFACSKEAGQWLFGKSVVKKRNFYILNNAIDAEKYRFDFSVRNEYRKKLDVEGKKVYIQIGRLSKEKNYIFSLQVIKELYSLDKSIYFFIVGNGNEKVGIQQKIQELGLSQCVTMLGARNDIPQLLQASDCMLFPSLWEGFGIVAIESQAAGLKTICSNYVPELVSITNYCTYLPLIKEKWVKEASALSYERQDTLLSVINSGFDINNTSKWLEEFYMECFNKVNKESGAN